MPQLDGFLFRRADSESYHAFHREFTVIADIPWVSLRRLPIRHGKSYPQGSASGASSRWRITASNDHTMRVPVVSRVSLGMNAHYNAAAITHIGHVRDSCQEGQAVTVDEAGREQRHPQHIWPNMSQGITDVENKKDALVSPAVADLQGNWFAATTTPVNSPDSQTAAIFSFILG